MSDLPLFHIETLLDWIEGRLTVDQAQLVAAAVANADSETRATVDWLRAFRVVSNELVFEALPDTTRSLLRTRFADYALSRQRPNIVQRFIATLRFDSLQQPMLAGVRGSVAAGRRQLVFQSDALDIIVNIRQRPADQHFELSGQVLSKNESATSLWTIRLLHGDYEVANERADDLGEFMVTHGIIAGQYTLLIQSHTTEVIAPLEFVA
jgi:hypothetical protein